MVHPIVLRSGEPDVVEGEVVAARRGESTPSSVDDLPVVARLVVEIRSDGTRTVARGAVEDLDGQRVTLEAHATTPWALAKQLASALWTMPRLPRPSLRSLLPGRGRKERG